MKKIIKCIAIATLALLSVALSPLSQAEEVKTTFIPIGVGDNFIVIPLLSAPSNSQSNDNGDGSYSLSWQGVTTASYYQVVVYDENGVVRSHQVNTTAFTLADLPLGQLRVSVFACKANGDCGAEKHIANYTVNERVHYVHADFLGSPILKTDQAGNVVEEYHYKPFGETKEDKKEQVGYTGHLEDTDLGLTYMQARYYDPVLGRFYSNDPVGTLGHLSQGNIQGFNRYAYANNNPYKYTDPDGEAAKLVVTGLKVLRKTIHSKGDFAGALKSEAGDIVDNVLTLADGKLDLNDVIAVVDLATGIDAGDVKSGLKAAENLRDSFSAAVKSKKPGAVTAGFDKKTGNIAAGRSDGCGSGGNCAEDAVKAALGKDADVSFTKATRPRNGREVPICKPCQETHGNDSFPSDALRD